MFTFGLNENLNFAEWQSRILRRVRYLDVFALFWAHADVVYQSACHCKFFQGLQAQGFPRVYHPRVVLFGGADGDADVLFPFRDVSVWYEVAWWGTFQIQSKQCPCCRCWIFMGMNGIVCMVKRTILSSFWTIRWDEKMELQNVVHTFFIQNAFSCFEHPCRKINIKWNHLPRWKQVELII